MNIATVIVLLVVATLVVVAVLSLRKGNGACECGDKKKSSCAGCSIDCPFKRNDPYSIK